MSYVSHDSVASNLHQQVHHLEAILAAAASSTGYKKIGHCEIRQCLRQIQACLFRKEGERLYEGGTDLKVTSDLMALLTLQYEYDDPMTAEMMNILIPRAAELISCYGGELTSEQLHLLLCRCMHFIQEPQQTPSFLNSLLTVLNQHLPSSRLPEVLGDDDQGFFIALESILKWYQEATNEYATYVSLQVLTLSLLEHLVNHILPNQDQTFPKWLQTQLMKHRSFSSFDVLESDAHDMIEQIEKFGVDLVENSLHLLERGVSSDGDSIFGALKQSTAATTFVTMCLSNEEFSSHFLMSSFSGMAKSLWQSLGSFVASQMENYSESIPQQMQVGATEALRNLTLAVTTNSSMVLDENSSSLIVFTVLRLLQYPEVFWTPQVQEWLIDQLSSSPYSRSLCHALQGTIVSQLSYHSAESQNGHITSFIELVMRHCGIDEEGSDDPWQSLVSDYLSDHLMVLNEAT